MHINLSVIVVTFSCMRLLQGPSMINEASMAGAKGFRVDCFYHPAKLHRLLKLLKFTFTALCTVAIFYFGSQF